MVRNKEELHREDERNHQCIEKCLHHHDFGFILITTEERPLQLLFEGWRSYTASRKMMANEEGETAEAADSNLWKYEVGTL